MRNRSYDCLILKLRKSPSLTTFLAPMPNVTIATQSMISLNGTAPSRGYRSAGQWWSDTECTWNRGTAVGRFPGQSPEEMLADITRHSRFTAEDFRVLATGPPIDVTDLHRHIRNMLADAQQFISRIPSDAVGVVFIDARGNAVQPDLDALDEYQRHAGRHMAIIAGYIKRDAGALQKAEWKRRQPKAVT